MFKVISDQLKKPIAFKTRPEAEAYSRDLWFDGHSGLDIIPVEDKKNV